MMGIVRVVTTSPLLTQYWNFSLHTHARVRTNIHTHTSHIQIQC